LNVGSMLTLSLTVPLAAALGWRTALASWGVLVLAALALWMYATRGPIRDTAAAADQPGDATTTRGRPAWWRRPKVWLLTAAFAGQAFAYYGVTAWLPLLLRDELGMAPGDAGLSASIFQIAALVGAFGVPVLLRVLPGPARVVLIVAVAWAALPLGLLLAPSLWPVWCARGRGGPGRRPRGGLLAGRAVSARPGRQPPDLRAGAGRRLRRRGGRPTVVGAVHEATGGWTAPLLVVLAAIVLLGVAGTASAGRAPRTADDRVVRADRGAVVSEGHLRRVMP
jgi:CP family cyanate transporter-like MFS transporter